MLTLEACLASGGAEGGENTHRTDCTARLSCTALHCTAPPVLQGPPLWQRGAGAKQQRGAGATTCVCARPTTKKHPTWNTFLGLLHQRAVIMKCNPPTHGPCLVAPVLQAVAYSHTCWVWRNPACTHACCSRCRVARRAAHTAHTARAGHQCSDSNWHAHTQSLACPLAHACKNNVSCWNRSSTSAAAQD